jgi:hypothetical protein
LINLREFMVAECEKVNLENIEFVPECLLQNSSYDDSMQIAHIPQPIQEHKVRLFLSYRNACHMFIS